MNNSVTLINECNVDNIVCMADIIQSTKKPKLNKDGTFSKRHSNKIAGVSSEVFAFKSKTEINDMINTFDKHINDAPDPDKLRIARRNKLLFILGINLGLRASDLRRVTFAFFFNKTQDGQYEFNEYYSLIPKKQKRCKKYIKLFFNETVHNAVLSYIKDYPIKHINDYVFVSRKGNDAITESTVWDIINKTAIEAGIKQNIGSHSLRKTFGFWIWHEADDKDKALVVLQQLFAHSSTQMTMKYIGILDEEIKDTYYSIKLGNDSVSFDLI